MRKTTKITCFFIMLGFIIVFSQCSKDRVSPKPVLNVYSTPDKFQNTNKQTEQIYVINRGGKCPIVCAQLSNVCLDSSLFVYSNGNPASCPFWIGVIELYSPKDIMLYTMSSVSGDKLLSTAGAFRLRAFVGSSNLAVKTGKTFSLTTKTVSSTDAAMKLFYGDASLTNWTPAGLGQVVVNPGNYQLNLAQTGWSAVSHIAASAGGTAVVNFTSDKDDLSNVLKFVYFDNLKTVALVTGSTSMNLPQGEHAIVVCYAADASGKMFYYTQSLTVGSNNTVNVAMQGISDTDLLAFLGMLR